MNETSAIEKLTALFADSARARRAPAEDAISSIGGWPAITEAAEHLIDEPLLVPILNLCVHELDTTGVGEGSTRAMAALANAIIATEDPATFIDALETLLTSKDAVEVVGTHLAGELAPLARAPRRDASPADIERHAAALEGIYRLAAGGITTSRRLQLMLEEITSPQPLRYARAVARVAPAAIDLWPAADDLSAAVNHLSGAAAPAEGMPEPGSPEADTYSKWTSGIAEDAAVAAANIALVRALRAPDPTTAQQQVTRALESLDLAMSADREDIAILASVLRLLDHLLLAHLRGGDTLGAGTLTPTVAAAFRERVQRWLVAGAGLTHWATKQRSDAYIAWSQLTDDLVALADHVSRDALYDAGVVMTSILRTYVRGRRFAVVAHDEDLGTLWQLIEPSVEQGFATRAGLFSNLVDHAHALERQLEHLSADDEQRQDLTGELSACHRLVDAARAVMDTAPISPGKDGGGLPFPVASPHPDTSPWWWEQLLPDGPEGPTDTRFAQRISDSLTVTSLSRPQSSAELAAIAAVRAKLQSSVDYRGTQKVAVDHMLELLVRFVADRANVEKKSRGYLFDPNATEADLHDDLKDFLTSQSRIQIERSHVGGGRCDIEVSYNGFHMYIELKADDSITPLPDKRTWSSQMAGYMTTDLRIGFLIALRRHPADAKRPDMHLTDAVGHTTVKVDGDSELRHVVTLSVVGNSVTPSQMRAGKS